jgi:hemoglobin-like flavoprotein
MNLALLRSTWRDAAGHGDIFVQWFYAQLFFDHPEMRDLFGADMAAQRAKLTETLDLVVAGADNLEAVVPKLRKLGRMHRRFGVTPDMYPAVGQALVATFARFLGEHWTREAAQTWVDAYGLVSGVMVADGLRIAVDPDHPWQPGGLVPVRLPARAGTWRTFEMGERHEILVPVDARPDAVTLDLLSTRPGDHLWLAAPLDPVDQEAHP